MRVKALTSFSGAISMAKGEERDIQNGVLLKDLLQAGYIETLEAEKQSEGEEETPEVATSQKTTKKGVKSNESK